MIKKKSFAIKHTSGCWTLVDVSTVNGGLAKGCVIGGVDVKSELAVVSGVELVVGSAEFINL